jgi:hypothetical protein
MITIASCWMQRLRHCLLALSAVAVISCGGGNDRYPVPFTEVGDISGDLYGDWPVMNYVIRNEADLDAAWFSFTTQREPPPTKPSIDFTMYAILGVSLGNGVPCTGVTILRITQLDSTMTVEYKSTDPEQFPPGLSCIPADYPRLQFVLVPAPVGAVVFKRVSG